MQHGLPSVEIAQRDVWDDKIAALLRSHGILGPKIPQKNLPKISKKNPRVGKSGAIPNIRPCGRADIPEWTGKPSLPDEDPDALWFLGDIILTPKSNVDLNDGSIGKGRQDDGDGSDSISIACARTRVAEKRYLLKRDLGPAFFELGFDRMGEDVALTWTSDEEMKFYNIIQKNRFPSKLWKKLRAAFDYKSREDIVSYYYNVYLVRANAFRNRAASCGDDPMAYLPTSSSWWSPLLPSPAQLSCFPIQIKWMF
ncbi:hypothetical protein PR202_ga00380 [Eleusine coracana subsp. coracana]|uniref:Uncharacterized protein n=1 Tax=Eleusine coracana subsp. coracana TaxID=191504 RepID=A0AAV5BGW6_ELECO|nr:hypothetical protein PR202_ga00380 [Eleusine coracana subsp. coracana]